MYIFEDGLDEEYEEYLRRLDAQYEADLEREYEKYLEQQDIEYREYIAQEKQKLETNDSETNKEEDQNGR